MKKQLANRFRQLRRIAPDAAKKDVFRSVLQATMNAYPVPANGARFSLRGTFFAMHKGALAFLLILLVLMGSTGATFAAQNALPGDVLYPVKLATENIRIAVAADPAEKAKLHLAFASRRLQELQQVADKPAVQSASIGTAFANYKTQLDESQKLLAQNPQETAPIATLIDAATTQNQETIRTLSEKTHGKPFAVAFRPYLEDADDHAESKNEDANLALLAASSTQDIVATSTEPVFIRHEFREKSHQKLESVKAKLQEVEQAVQQVQGTVDPAASQKIEQAKTDLEKAASQLEEGSYEDSFIASVQARRNTQDARRIFEREQRQREFNSNPWNQESGISNQATSSVPQLRNEEQHWYNGIFRRDRINQENESDN